MSGEFILFSSPNYDDRPLGAVVDKVILHYTGMPTAEEALAKLCDDSAAARDVGRVSSHYFVDVRGQIFSLVNERERAWHAGDSYWRGERGLNNTSIGIEIVNPGHEHGYVDFTALQIDAVVELLRGICKRHKVPAYNVLGHSDVAPGRKSDPGEKFNWKRLARKGFGVWPEVQEQDYVRGQAYLSSPTALRAGLLKFGYSPDVETDVLVRAFNMHFAGNNSDVLSWEAAASLSWLNRNCLQNIG